jgi:multiple sugar transport system permease protein
VHLIGGVLVILPFSFFPFGVYLAYIYYATDATRPARRGAWMAPRWQTFRRVALPWPPIVALFFFSFVADWNNFLPFAVLADSSQYDQVGLRTAVVDPRSTRPRAAAVSG